MYKVAAVSNIRVGGVHTVNIEFVTAQRTEAASLLQYHLFRMSLLEFSIQVGSALWSVDRVILQMVASQVVLPN